MSKSINTVERVLSGATIVIGFGIFLPGCIIAGHLESTTTQMWQAVGLVAIGGAAMVGGIAALMRNP